jgi:hypothetical protein
VTGKRTGAKDRGVEQPGALASLFKPVRIRATIAKPEGINGNQVALVLAEGIGVGQARHALLG